MALQFNGRNNKYFIDKEASSRLSPEQLRAAKINNQYLMAVFTKLVGSEGNNVEDAFGQDYLTCILDNKLPKSDAETGVPSYNLGAKLCFLAKTLKNNADARVKFQNSFFFQLIEVFRRGTTDYSSREHWENYQYTSNCPERYRVKTPFAIAVLCHARDTSTPIGINFCTLIDSLIGIDRNGNYYIKTDFDKLGSQAQEMNSACKEHLRMLKSNPTFQSYFEQDFEQDNT